ncbi:MAG: response regulator [Proteobacteria bacterium]|nr:response regulator [Pseudomonadota bacterium]MBU1717213.1 response regulator [Pseudomonadota bacterium]
MKNVLIVDDEKSFLLSLTDMLKDNKDKFSILTANDGKEAIKVLNSKSVDMVVTDLKMPEMDGFDLMAHISSTSPDTPVIIMTAYGTPEMESRLMNMGAFQYIEKPIDFNTLLHKITAGLDAGTKGHVDGISLPSFLQLLELDNKTCTLTLRSGKNIGQMFFKQGKMIDAQTGELTGQPAAFEIICWENTAIEIENVCKKQEIVITTPLGFLLIESARMKDERGSKPEEEKPASPASAVDNLDFGESKPKEIDPADLASPPEAPPVASAQSRHPLAEKIIGTAGVQKMILISRDGTIMAQHNTVNKEFGAFIAFATSSVIKLKNALGFNGPQHIILGEKSGSKILILLGPQVIVGLEVDAQTSPGNLADELRPQVAKATAK